MNPWLKCLRSRPGAALRLFCFPYAGGGTMIYRTWPEGLSSNLEILCAQLPGREARLGESPYSRLSDTVEAMADAILPYLDRPFVFFGHSMGALMAFELALRLRRSCGLEPAHIFISGRRAPQLSDPERLGYDLPDSEFIDWVARLKGLPKEVLQNAEIMQFVLPLLRADFAACDTYSYVPEFPLTCSITALGGLADQQIGREDLAAWREQTNGPFTLRMLNGDHFFVNSCRADLLRVIERELQPIFDRAQESSERRQR